MKRNFGSNPLKHWCSWLAVSVVLFHTAHAATYLWNVPSPGFNNWSVNANWSPSTGNPGPADTAVFSDLGTGPDMSNISSVVSVNTTVAGLQYTNLNNGEWYVTQIPSGTALTVSGSVLIGGQTNGETTLAAMTGGGSFFVVGSSN